MLHNTSAASRIAVVSQPAIRPGSQTSCGFAPNSPVSHGWMVTGIQPAFATRNSPATTPSPIIDSTTVEVAIRRSQRITRSILSREVAAVAALRADVDRVAERDAQKARAEHLAVR